jgi:hypothetical protein
MIDAAAKFQLMCLSRYSESPLQALHAEELCAYWVPIVPGWHRGCRHEGAADERYQLSLSALRVSYPPALSAETANPCDGPSRHSRPAVAAKRGRAGRDKSRPGKRLNSRPRNFLSCWSRLRRDHSQKKSTRLTFSCRYARWLVRMRRGKMAVKPIPSFFWIAACAWWHQYDEFRECGALRDMFDLPTNSFGPACQQDHLSHIDPARNCGLPRVVGIECLGGAQQGQARLWIGDADKRPDHFC